MKQVNEALKKKRVMVMIDESESSYYALMWLLNNLNTSLHRATLLLVAAHPLLATNYAVSPPLGYANLYFSPTQPASMFDSAQEKNKKVALGILEKAKSICTALGIDAETVLEFGNPKDAICDAVLKHNISLLIVGNHDIGFFKRVFEGSVTDYCLKNAKCPVLVVKKKE